MGLLQLSRPSDVWVTEVRPVTPPRPRPEDLLADSDGWVTAWRDHAVHLGSHPKPPHALTEWI
jgi:hypothetical protein